MFPDELGSLRTQVKNNHHRAIRQTSDLIKDTNYNVQKVYIFVSIFTFQNFVNGFSVLNNLNEVHTATLPWTTVT